MTRTLQELLAEGLAQRQAAARAANEWVAKRPEREAAAVDLFRTWMQKYEDIALGDDVILDAAEDADTGVNAYAPAYWITMTLPALGFIGRRFEARFHAHELCVADDHTWRVSTPQGTYVYYTSILDALMWLTDNGSTSFDGIPVTMPEYQEA